jgi:hypothetical protein
MLALQFSHLPRADLVVRGHEFFLHGAPNLPEASDTYWTAHTFKNRIGIARVRVS